MTEVKTNTDVFENAFIGVMNMLREKREALFGFIVTNYHGRTVSEMKRVSYDLSPLTLAWYDHRYCTLDSNDEELNIFINMYLHSSGGDENFSLDFLDRNEDEERELNLRDDRYERAFGDLMMLLMARNSSIFEEIRSAASNSTEKNIHDSAHENVKSKRKKDTEKDIELMKLGHVWKIWCDQNPHKRSVEEFENLQIKIQKEEMQPIVS